MPLAQVLIALLILIPASAGLVRAEPISIRFNQGTTSVLKVKACEYFKRLVEQRTNNRIAFDIIADNSPEGAQRILADLQSGAVQMAAPDIATLYEFEPALQIFDLPFLFNGSSHLHRVLDSEVGTELLTATSQKGLIALAFWDNGLKQLTANRPLTQPEQLAQLRLSVSGADVLNEQLISLKVLPLKVSPELLYKALLEVTVDGQENTLEYIYDQELYRVQSDLLISNHGYQGYLVIANAAFWSGLPDDLQVIMRGAIKDAADYTREMSLQGDRVALQKIQASGLVRIQELTRTQRKHWQQMAQEFYPLAYDRIDNLLVQKALALELR